MSGGRMGNGQLIYTNANRIRQLGRCPDAKPCRTHRPRIMFQRSPSAVGVTPFSMHMPDEKERTGGLGVLGRQEVAGRLLTGWSTSGTCVSSLHAQERSISAGQDPGRT